MNLMIHLRGLIVILSCKIFKGGFISKAEDLTMILAKRTINTVILSEIIIYSVAWSYISLSEFYSLHAYVYDTGLNMQTLWSILYTHWTAYTFFKYFMYSGLEVIFSPLLLFHSYPLLYVVVTVALALPVIPIFKIAHTVLKNDLVALLISSSYLIYFPLAGENWFAFHFQSFFIIFFLLGYSYYLEDKIKLSLLFFLLSAIVTYPLSIFPLMFSLTEIANLRLSNKIKITETRKMNFLIILTFISFILLLSGYLTSSVSALGGELHVPTLGIIAAIHYNIGNKIYTIELLLIPILFINILSPRWLLFLLPYVGALFLSTVFGGYQYPFYTGGHYFFLIIPFVYIGMIYGVSNFGRIVSSLKKRVSALKRINPKKANSTVSIVIIIFVLILIFSLFYQPYGPLNKYTTDNYDIGSNINVNMTLYYDVLAVEELIPANTSLTTILIQDDLPTVLPKPTNDPYQYAFVPVLVNLSNWNNLSVINENRFPINPPNGNGINFTTIQYVIGYKGSWLYYAGNPSMYEIYNQMLKSNHYTQVIDISGVFLLKRN